MDEQQRDEWEPASPWGEGVPYRTIEMKIGEELRERFKLPQDMPDKLHKLLTLVTQIDGEDQA
jgi:hypothetical protein